MKRRDFLVGSAAAMAAPYILSSRAKAATLKVRRDVMTMAPNDPFFQQYAEAVTKMHSATDSRNWRQQALIHLNYCPHGSVQFVHWHRFYITYFEAICGELIGNPNFTLPYWNWSVNKGIIPAPFYDIDALNVTYWKDVGGGAHSPNWDKDRPVNTIGVRGLKKGEGLQDDPIRGGAFTAARIDSILRSSVFTTFTNQLETQPHNNGHVVSGAPNGHMIDGLSPLDPIFWLHHCCVDKVWAQWQAAGNTTPGYSTSYDGQFVDASGNKVKVASSGALDFRKLGFTYDVLEGAAVVAQREQLGLRAGAQKLLSTNDIGGGAKTLGATSGAKKIAVGVETSFKVAAPNLLGTMFKPRTFWTPNTLGVPRAAVEQRRFYAVIDQIATPSDTSVLVNAFVNNPNLTPDTPTTDPHYAGTFSFFGMGGAHHGGGKVIVDITEPLRNLASDGRLTAEEISVQLMPVPSVAGAQSNAEFSVGKVEIRVE